MTDIMERYNGLIRTGFDYAEKEKGCAPTSVFEIYVGHFKDIGAEIEAEITTLRKELAEARAENETLAHTVEFVTRWAWREDPPNSNAKLSVEERLNAIKFHPSIRRAADGETKP